MGARPPFQVRRLVLPYLALVVSAPVPQAFSMWARRQNEVLILRAENRFHQWLVTHGDLVVCPLTLKTWKHEPSGRHFTDEPSLNAAAHAYDTDDVSEFFEDAAPEPVPPKGDTSPQRSHRGGHNERLHGWSDSAKWRAIREGAGRAKRSGHPITFATVARYMQPKMDYRTLQKLLDDLERSLDDLG
jgi:hypothetical protein